MLKNNRLNDSIVSQEITLIDTFLSTRLLSGSWVVALLTRLILAIAGSLVIWTSAKVQIPFYPVPITLQTMVVLMVGMAYGWKLGTFTIFLYLAEGALGLPVFAGTPEKGMGWVYMVGPTAGYLVGFIPAVALVGWLAEKGWDKSVVKTALAMFLGNLIIYFFGISWLGNLLGWDQPILQWGLIPFLPGDVFKVVFAAASFPMVWKFLHNLKK